MMISTFTSSLMGAAPIVRNLMRGKIAPVALASTAIFCWLNHSFKDASQYLFWSESGVWRKMADESIFILY